MRRRRAQQWWKQGIGKLKPYTGKYSFVRLKRKSKNKYNKAVGKYSVQVKNKKGKWKTIDTFTSVDDAVELLCKEANNIDLYRQIVGDFD